MDKRNKVLMILSWVLTVSAVGYFLGVGWINKQIAGAYQKGVQDMSNNIADGINASLAKDGYVSFTDTRDKDKPKTITLVPAQPKPEATESPVSPVPSK